MAIAVHGRSGREHHAIGDTALGGIVLLTDRSDLSRMIYHALAADFQIDAVIREAKASRALLLARRLRKHGWRTVLGQVAFLKCVVPFLQKESAHRRKELIREFGLDDSAIPRKYLIDVVSVNDAATLGLLEKLLPRVIIVNGTRLLEEKTLHATTGVFLNTHVGITPLYRGVHGGYWALASRDPEHFGVTVHKIDKGIDTGDIVAHAFAAPTKADNFSTYPLLQIATAVPLLKQAVSSALANTLETVKGSGTSRLWTHPTAWEYMRIRMTRGVR
jgi:folate-dependent phosphoribosylglycinamide formyltransferase PurN